MYHTLVRPIALYGAEFWTLLPSQEHVVDVHEMRWLCQLLRVTRYAKLRNNDIRQLARCRVPLSEACRQYRLRYYGHISRQPAGRAPRTALFLEAPGPRNPGHPHTTWLDLIDMDAATRGLTRADLDELALDRDLYRERVTFGDRLDGRPT